MLTTPFALIFLACSITQAFAATVSLFPPGFSSDAGLNGEAVGTGSIGTTYVLSGTTSDIPFTVTLVEGPSQIAETFNIPSMSLAVAEGCIVSGSDALCEQVVQGGASGETATLTQTVSFVPFEIAVTSGSALSSSTSGSSSSSGTSGTSASQSTVTALSTSQTNATPSATQTSSADVSGKPGVLVSFASGVLAFMVVLGIV